MATPVRTRELSGERIAALLAVLGLHAVLILLLLHERQTYRFRSEGSLVLIDLAPPSVRVAPYPPPSRATPASGQPRQESTLLPAGEATPAAASPAVPAAIDWANEASVVAGASASKSEPRSLSNGLPPRLDLQMEKPHTPSDFGWDAAHTRRIEALPEGGTLVRLNDRCALVVGLPLILPVCKLGKIPARGDLFKNMGETRQEPAVP